MASRPAFQCLHQRRNLRMWLRLLHQQMVPAALVQQGITGRLVFDSRVSWTHLLLTRGFFPLKSHRIRA